MKKVFLNAMLSTVVSTVAMSLSGGVAFAQNAKVNLPGFELSNGLGAAQSSGDASAMPATQPRLQTFGQKTSETELTTPSASTTSSQPEAATTTSANEKAKPTTRKAGIRRVQDSVGNGAKTSGQGH